MAALLAIQYLKKWSELFNTKKKKTIYQILPYKISFLTGKIESKPYRSIK